MGNYATITQATDYIENNKLPIKRCPWDDATTEEKQIALNISTKIIDKLNYAGDKADESQENQFPRGSDTSVPQKVEYAAIEIALALLDGVDPELERENLMATQFNYADARSTYNRGSIPEHIVVGVPSSLAMDYLRPFLRDRDAVHLSRGS
jgi:hypothetical protein